MAKLCALRGPWYDSSGNVLNAGLIYTYQTGTTTAKAAYADAAETTPLTNPIQLNSAGCKTFYIKTDTAYRFVIKTSSGTTVETIDDITPLTLLATGTGGANVDISGYALITSANQDLHISPNGTGKLYLGSLKMPTAAPTSNQVLAATDATTLTWANPNTGSVQGDSNPTLSANLIATTFFVKFSDGAGIMDANNASELVFFKTAAAVNYITMTNNATGSGPTIAAAGSDANIVLNLSGKGSSGVVANILTSTGAFTASNTATFNGAITVNSQNITMTNGQSIATSNGPVIKLNDAASAVNYVQVNSVATGNRPGIQATGTDANIDLELLPKGTGQIRIGGTKLPTTTGTNTQVLTADGSGGSSWTSPSSFGSLTKIDTKTASASATIDFTGLSSTYKAYLVIGNDVIVASAGANLNWRVGTGGTPTWDSGSNYAYTCTSANSTTSYSSSNSTTNGSVAVNAANSSPNEINFQLLLHNPAGGSYTHLEGSGSFWNNLSNHTSTNFTGCYLSATAVTGLRFLCSAGNITSGTFILYGIS